MAKRVSRSKRANKRLIAIISVIICIALLFGAYRLRMKIRDYEQKQEELTEEIEKQQSESERLEKESEYMGTLEYIEKIAREKLGMVKENEILIKKDE